MTRLTWFTRKAFTLIELLVVIAIIALVIAILLPALASARSTAQAAVCMTQMRSLGQFTALYADANRERMPRSQHSAFAHRVAPWGYAYFEFITGDSYSSTTSREAWLEVFNSHYRCPLDRRLDRWSYGYNVYYELTQAETLGRTWNRRCTVPFPSSTVLFGELAIGGADHAMAHFWTQFGTPPEIDAQRHGRATGVVFLDGHAASLPFESVFDRVTGINCFNPERAQLGHQ